jgi:hypothetical protein
MQPAPPLTTTCTSSCPLHCSRKARLAQQSQKFAMRLLNVHTLKLHTFYGDAIPKYTILSHTWLAADEEVTFLHLQTQESAIWRRLPGAKKILYTCQQARDYGHNWAWVDTCCIDKSNNAELSEAINSMFRWYQRSEVCYVYLSDYVCRPNSDLFASRWWTRAWTLQELVAPECVRFFDAHWQEIGTKSDRADDIASRMSIDVGTLRDSKRMYSQCVAQRMSWAAHREATREEDLAYSLLGIFNINMTMQYGEGEKAFVRLQQEIMRTTNDMSTFAWGFDPRPLEEVCSTQTDRLAKLHRLEIINAGTMPGQISTYGLYADSPRRFRLAQIEHLALDIDDLGCEERHGVQNLKTMVVRYAHGSTIFHNRCTVALLPCRIARGPSHYLVGILLRGWHQNASRNMRHAFRGEVFSCLVRGDHAIGAMQDSVKIDPRENQLLQQPATYCSPDRTLLIKMDNMAYYPFRVLQPVELVQVPSHRDIFMISRFDSRRSTVILRFRHPGAKLSVFVGFTTYQDIRQDGRKLHRCVIRPEPSSTTNDILQEIHNSLELSSADSAPKVCGLDSCKHDCLRVTVETTFVFNQALTTLTLARKKKGSYDKGPYTAAVCVAQKDRLGSSRK